MSTNGRTIIKSPGHTVCHFCFTKKICLIYMLSLSNYTIIYQSHVGLYSCVSLTQVPNSALIHVFIVTPSITLYRLPCASPYRHVEASNAPIHCLQPVAWKFHFPSKTEKLLWRISCVVVMSTFLGVMALVRSLNSRIHIRNYREDKYGKPYQLVGLKFSRRCTGDIPINLRERTDWGKDP